MSPLGAKLFVGMQYLLPQHALSRAVYKLTRSRARPVKNALIGAFVRHFKPQMQEAAQADPYAYPSFNEFFTRALRSGLRPADPDPLAVVSPVDGTISEIGRLEGARLLQAKGIYYSLETLFEDHAQYAARFIDGAFATLYLAPFDYHRIHMPLPGTLKAAWYVPGDLFSVNTTTAASVAGLFARNERVVCVFEHGPLMFALVLVGALFVGSMETVWHGEIVPRPVAKPAELAMESSRATLSLPRGAEMGRFNMGSTVILLLPPHAAEWLASFKSGTKIRLGQALARLSQPLPS